MANSTTTIVTSNSVETIISESPSVTAKVDKVEGKNLSTNDYTTDEKTKLSGIEAGAQVNIVKSVTISGSGNSVTNATFNNGALTLTKGTASVPTEATEDEITTGTVTTKFISPAKNNKAVWQGIVNDSTGMALGSENQKKVQNWIGTNQLTFTFNDNTTRTFNFVCNEVL